jgi:RNA polymerase sigma-70 factor, ECF subfamily
MTVSAPDPDAIYREYRARLLGFIRQRVRDHQLAEDILQDVFVKVLAKLDTLMEPAKLRAWLYQVTRNAIIDHSRLRRVHDDLDEETFEALPDAIEESSAASELARCLAPMIEALPAHYREAVMLADIEALPLATVAARQQLSLPGAKSRVQRGRARVGAMLLACCRIELSKSGAVLDYTPRAPTAKCDPTECRRT